MLIPKKNRVEVYKYLFQGKLESIFFICTGNKLKDR
jgi:hypothetical protein